MSLFSAIIKENAISRPLSPSLSKAVDSMALNTKVEERGAVFTHPMVAEFILDLTKYTPESPLYNLRFLEPSCGRGDFLFPAIKRLLHSWRTHHPGSAPEVADLSEAITAVELHHDTYQHVIAEVRDLLLSEGLSKEQSETLAHNWIKQGDFLLLELPGSFDFVAGNPPYVRQELIPDILIKEYRTRYQTIYDRADLYIPFLERSLTLLSKQGTLGFICPDRWLKNRYGGPLRSYIAQHFHLSHYIDMVDTPAFQSEVSAYAAIFVFTPKMSEVHTSTRIAHRPPVEEATLKTLSRQLTQSTLPATTEIREIEGVTSGTSPWLLENSRELDLVRRLEAQFTLLEEAGCKVGIGVASGADKIFIGPYEQLPVEEDRKLPLVMTRDIDGGHLNWKGQGIVNPFTDDGRLVNLNEFPLLQRYFEQHAEALKSRHVSSKNRANWYRTIDRIYPELAFTPKLLIPDIKGDAQIVLEEGSLYPHHNLYFITSTTWNLKALQAVLCSGIARLFVARYTTKMRGGYLRFQAQYLRRIRLPNWDEVPAEIKNALIQSAIQNDPFARNKAVSRLYGLSIEEEETLFDYTA